MSTSNIGQNDSIAENLICPITLELPWDPVIAEDGRIYDQGAIENHFKQHPNDLKSPVTNMPMGRHLLPAFQIKSLIEALIEKGMITEDLTPEWNQKMKQNKKLEELKKKANSGDGVAMRRLGNMYCSGSHGLQKDLKVAVTWYKKSHEQGNATGTAHLGDFICKGLGGEATCHITGIMYISTAAGQKSKIAAFYLGMAMADGLYGLTVKKEEAIYWLERALGNFPGWSDGLSSKGIKQAQSKLKGLKATLQL